MSTKKNRNNTASNNNTASKPASKPGKKVIGLGKTMTEADIQALEARLAATEAALLQSEADKAALQAKVKTSSRREVKAPAEYDILQPLFVAVRGYINKGIVKDSVLLDIFNTSADKLSIAIDEKLSEKLFERTVLHNSSSNASKARDAASLAGRDNAFNAMLEQAKVILPLIKAVKWQEYKDTYQSASNKALKALK